MFGDGWSNQALEIENLVNSSMTVSTGLTCKCQLIHYCFDNFQNAKGNISIVTVDPTKDVRHGWESHFTFVDDNGVIYVGNQYSTLHIWKGQVTCYDCVDYSLNNTHNRCDRCKHPPPPPPPAAPKKSGGGSDKPKTNNSRHLSETGERLLAIMEVDEMAATAFVVTANSSGPGGSRGGGGEPAKAKRPPLNFPFVLIDETSSIRGWYEDTGNNRDMCGLPTPTLLSYPKYYISDAARTKLIHSGTICGPHSPEKCQEVLPYDGKFVWRVGGYDANPDDIQWHFCTVDGGLGQELSFTMKNGKCVPGDMIDADDYCNGVVTLAMLVGQLRVNVQSAEQELSVAETRALETKLSKDLFMNSKVAINSYTQDSSGGSFLMTFTATLRVEEVSKFIGTVDGQLDAFEEAMQASVGERVSTGTLLASLQATVAGDPNLMSSQLSGAYAISLVSLSLDRYEFEVKDRILERPSVEGSYTDTAEFVEESQLMGEFVYYATGATVCVVLIAVVVVIATRQKSSPGFVRVPSQSDLDSSESALVESATLPTADISITLDEKVSYYNRRRS